MSKITIFTDGSSKGNPGPGGWGVILVQSEKCKVQSENKDGTGIIEFGGREEHTTNNRMELTAAINGVSNAPGDGEITVFSDSTYIIKGITEWIHGWKRNGWRTKSKDDVLNKDLWMKLDEAIKGKNIHWKHVAGHVGIAGNERCDEIATGFADGKDVKLYNGSIEGYDLKL